MKNLAFSISNWIFYLRSLISQKCYWCYGIAGLYFTNLVVIIKLSISYVNIFKFYDINWHTFRYALHEKEYVILISRIRIWAWSRDGHATVMYRSRYNHELVTLRLHYGLVVIRSRLVVEPLTWGSWAGHGAVMGWSRGGHESVTRRSWSGHVTVMNLSRYGHESVTRRSWVGHAAVMSRSRGGHESVTLRACFGRFSACRRLRPVQAGRISRIGRCRRRAPLACPPKWPKQQVTVRGDNLQQKYNF